MLLKMDKTQLAKLEKKLIGARRTAKEYPESAYIHMTQTHIPLVLPFVHTNKIPLSQELKLIKGCL